MATITVRRIGRRPIFSGGSEHSYSAARAWAVYVHGLRIPGLYVVDAADKGVRGFRTVIRDGEMVTGWHIGLGPGDMARRYAWPADEAAPA